MMKRRKMYEKVFVFSFGVFWHLYEENFKDHYSSLVVYVTIFKYMIYKESVLLTKVICNENSVSKCVNWH